MDEGRYLLATERLNTIRSQYPYSYYATHAELLQADILFLQENYVEAAAAYILFKDFHPKHTQMNYVIWKIAESFFNQLPSTYDRDLSAGFEAMKYYEELITKYTDSQYVEDAKNKIRICKNMIEMKEKYIADFYFRTEVYDSARFRYLKILDTIDDKEIRAHAMVRIVESSLHLGKYEECISYYDQFNILVSGDNKEYMEKNVKTCKHKLEQGG